MISWHTKLLSYLRDQHIESVESDHNTMLDLYLINNRLQLCTNEAIYSYDDYYYNFGTAFHEIKLPEDHSSVLILGLGLGSIPYLLEKVHDKQYHYTGVEIDESVLYLFSKYQSNRLASSIDIIETDALAYLNASGSTFDMICIDVFIGEDIPSTLKKSHFMHSIDSHLTENGIVLWNTLYADAKQKIETNRLYDQFFSKIFKDSHSIDIMGNKILVGTKKG